MASVRHSLGEVRYAIVIIMHAKAAWKARNELITDDCGVMPRLEA